MGISVWSPCYALSCLRRGIGKWVGVRGRCSWLLLAALVSVWRHRWGYIANLGASVGVYEVNGSLIEVVEADNRGRKRSASAIFAVVVNWG